MSQSTPAPAAASAAFTRLRFPLAWVLLGSVILNDLIGLGHLLIAPKSFSSLTFSDRALAERPTYLSLLVVGLLVAAALLVTTVGGAAGSARPVVLTSLVLVGVGLLLGFVTLVAGLLASNRFSLNGGREKVETVLASLPVMAAYVLVGLVLLALLSAAELRRPPKAPPVGYGQPYAGYPTGQQPYGYPSGQTYDPQQGYGQAGYPPGYPPGHGQQSSPQQGHPQQPGYQQQDYQQPGQAPAAPTQVGPTHPSEPPEQAYTEEGYTRPQRPPE